MKSVMIAAAMCAAFCLAIPAADAATTAKGPTDMQIYCSLFSWTAKCATPAKPVAKAVPLKPARVAMAKPAVKPAAAKTGIKTMACVKAAPDKAYLYDCHWK